MTEISIAPAGRPGAAEHGGYGLGAPATTRITWRRRSVARQVGRQTGSVQRPLFSLADDWHSPAIGPREERLTERRDRTMLFRKPLLRTDEPIRGLTLARGSPGGDPRIANVPRRGTVSGGVNVREKFGESFVVASFYPRRR
jgi:hypothetical protein